MGTLSLGAFGSPASSARAIEQQKAFVEQDLHTLVEPGKEETLQPLLSFGADLAKLTVAERLVLGMSIGDRRAVETVPAQAAKATATKLLEAAQPVYVGDKPQNGPTIIAAVNLAATLLKLAARHEYLEQPEKDETGDSSGPNVSNSQQEIYQHIWETAASRAEVSNAKEKGKEIAQKLSAGARPTLAPEEYFEIAHALIDAANDPSADVNDFYGRSASQSRLNFKLTALNMAAELLTAEVS
jgi:hypothetical protein